MDSTPQISELPTGFKWCSGCKKNLPKIWFKGKLCRKCAPKANREKRLMAKFGVTTAEYNELLASQGGGCAICGNKPKTGKFAVDHDHKTGQVRGILCLWCNNRLLGGARESITILARAIEYLKHPPAANVIGVRIVPTSKD